MSVTVLLQQFKQFMKRLISIVVYLSTYDLPLVRTPRAFIPTGWGQNTAFWDRLRTGTKHISAMEHDIYKRKSIYKDFPTGRPNLVNFGPETVENGWRVFAHPSKFSHWETLLALRHGRYITVF